MINLQNEIFWQAYNWNNQMVPSSDWASGLSSELRKYWGWNEIPVDKYIVDNVENWDCVVVKLPADVCDKDRGMMDNPYCLDGDAPYQLERDLDQFVKAGKLVPG